MEEEEHSRSELRITTDVSAKVEGRPEPYWNCPWEGFALGCVWNAGGHSALY